MRSAKACRTWASVKPHVTSGQVSFAMMIRQRGGPSSATIWSADMAPVARTRASARVFTVSVHLHFAHPGHETRPTARSHSSKLLRGVPDCLLKHPFLLSREFPPEQKWVLKKAIWYATQ